MRKSYMIALLVAIVAIVAYFSRSYWMSAVVPNEEGIEYIGLVETGVIDEINTHEIEAIPEVPNSFEGTYGVQTYKIDIEDRMNEIIRYYKSGKKCPFTYSEFFDQDGSCNFQLNEEEWNNLFIYVSNKQWDSITSMIPIRVRGFSDQCPTESIMESSTSSLVFGHSCQAPGPGGIYYQKINNKTLEGITLRTPLLEQIYWSAVDTCNQYDRSTDEEKYQDCFHTEDKKFYSTYLHRIMNNKFENIDLQKEFDGIMII